MDARGVPGAAPRHLGTLAPAAVRRAASGRRRSRARGARSGRTRTRPQPADAEGHSRSSSGRDTDLPRSTVTTAVCCEVADPALWSKGGGRPRSPPAGRCRRCQFRGRVNSPVPAVRARPSSPPTLARHRASTALYTLAAVSVAHPSSATWNPWSGPATAPIRPRPKIQSTERSTSPDEASVASRSSGRSPGGCRPVVNERVPRAAAPLGPAAPS